MGWKNWPTWVKGGIYGFFVLVFLFLLLIPAGLTLISNNKPSIVVRTLFNITLFIPIFLRNILPTTDNRTIEFLIQVIPLIIIYFVTGAVIGWIVGKIKSNKQKKLIQK